MTSLTTKHKPQLIPWPLMPIMVVTSEPDSLLDDLQEHTSLHQIQTPHTPSDTNATLPVCTATSLRKCRFFQDDKSRVSFYFHTSMAINPRPATLSECVTSIVEMFVQPTEIHLVVLIDLLIPLPWSPAFLYPHMSSSCLKIVIYAPQLELLHYELHSDLPSSNSNSFYSFIWFCSFLLLDKCTRTMETNNKQPEIGKEKSTALNYIVK